MRLEVRPTVQLTYKLNVADLTLEGGLAGAWAASPPDGSSMFIEEREDPTKMTLRWNIPDRQVGPDGTLLVQYRNLSPLVATVLHDDLRLYSPAGTFTWNFLRGMLLILGQVAFLAALGVLAGSFASFPVGSLVCFALLPFSMARGFLSDAVRIPEHAATVSPLVYLGNGVLWVMSLLLPDFARTSPSDALADGTHITWAELGATWGLSVAIPCAAALLAACVIFRRRELARVQV